MKSISIQTTLKPAIVKKLDTLIEEQEVFDNRSSYIRKIIMEHIEKR